MATSSIVCGIDGSAASSEAARLALAIARRVGARLDLIALQRGSGRAEPLRRAERLATELEGDPGLEVAVRIVTGSAAEHLIAASREAALVVVPTGSRRGAGGGLTGKVARAVARLAISPVLVLPPAAAARTPATARRGILCGVRDAADLPSVATAACWARDLGVDLTLAHMTPGPKLPIAPAGGAPPPGLVHGADERRAEALEMLDEMARTVSPICAPCRGIAVEGSAGRELVRLAAAGDAMLVAIGPRRHRPLTGLLSGSVSRHLLRRCRRPVLVAPSPETAIP